MVYRERKWGKERTAVDTEWWWDEDLRLIGLDKTQLVAQSPWEVKGHGACLKVRQAEHLVTGC